MAIVLADYGQQEPTMPNYSVAVTKDRLSSLIDKALAGEEVIITRHGKPTAMLSAVPDAQQPKPSKAEIYEMIRQLHETQPKNGTPYMEMKRQEEAESRY